jgi:hypothetical protein
VTLIAKSCRFEPSYRDRGQIATRFVIATGIMRGSTGFGNETAPLETICHAWHDLC